MSLGISGAVVLLFRDAGGVGGGGHLRGAVVPHRVVCKEGEASALRGLVRPPGAPQATVKELMGLVTRGVVSRREAAVVVVLSVPHNADTRDMQHCRQ